MSILPSTSQRPGKVGGVPADLSTINLHLTAVIGTLEEHFGKEDGDSVNRVNAARKALKVLLGKKHEGLVHISHAAREGIFVLEDTLVNGMNGYTPLYAVKRFETLQQAEHVANLAKSLGFESNVSKAIFDVKYLNTPECKWPLQVNGYSALFLQEIVGEDLVSVMPRVNERISRSDQAASAFKKDILRFGHDNWAYWQNFVKLKGHTAQMQPQKIREFIVHSLVSSASALEQVTDRKLTDSQKAGLVEAAPKLVDLIGMHATMGLDSGPRNIMVAREVIQAFENSTGIQNGRAYDTPLTRAAEEKPRPTIYHNGIFQVDLPSEWRTVHELRDGIRLAFAPVTGNSFDEAMSQVAYGRLRADYLDTKKTDAERTAFSHKVGLLFNGKMTPETVFAGYYTGGTLELLVNVAAESARMNRQIPLLFLSRMKDELEGKIPPTDEPDKLEARYADLVSESRGWAQRGLEATERMKPELARIKAYDSLAALFQSWAEASPDRSRLPQYRQFLKV